MAFSRQIRFPDSVIREPLKFSNPVARGQIKLPEETTPPTTAAPPSPTTKPPSPTTKPPSPTTKPPSPTTKPPSPTTTPPSPTTKPPSPTTARPSSTTKPPSSTTKPPSSTTKPPSSTTARPSSTTAPPSSTTARPSPTTASPSSTTARPSPTTARPSSTPAPLDVELDSTGIIAFFNGFRSAIAKGVFPDGSPTKLAQSEGLFKIVDDPTLAKYAAAVAVGTVDVRPPAEYSRAVYSTQLTYASDSTFVRKALDVWYRYAVDVLPADNATYLQRDVTTLEGYAQAVYYKSVRGSCVIRRNIFSTPSGKKGTILACVFNSSNPKQYNNKDYPKHYNNYSNPKQYNNKDYPKHYNNYKNPKQYNNKDYPKHYNNYNNPKQNNN
ncbi:hypothetical protein Q1695_008241 [Nippostrongylus brasiliensis]|nr:hypothetical protein Q1695_008241 [Nippostrongylus brasiliensis]